MALLLVATVAVIGFYALQTTDQSKPLPSTAVTALSAALASIPPGDVGGRDLDGLPRPPGAVRSYYANSGKVVTVIYVQDRALVDVRADLEKLLAAAGWAPVGADTASPSPVAEQTPRFWHAVFAFKARVLQVTMARREGVTSTTYVLQTSG